MPARLLWNWKLTTNRFVRRWLERSSQPPVSLRQVDPLIRQLTLYRDLIEERIQDERTQNTQENQ